MTGSPGAQRVDSGSRPVASIAAALWGHRAAPPDDSGAGRDHGIAAVGAAARRRPPRATPAAPCRRRYHAIEHDPACGAAARSASSSPDHQQRHPYSARHRDRDPAPAPAFRAAIVVTRRAAPPRHARARSEALDASGELDPDDFAWRGVAATPGPATMTSGAAPANLELEGELVGGSPTLPANGEGVRRLEAAPAIASHRSRTPSLTIAPCRKRTPSRSTARAPLPLLPANLMR
jgi:hypothetical protein